MEKINFRCNKVLPAVYDDALSYYEALCKLANAVNELIEQWNVAGTLPAPVEGQEGWMATVIGGEWVASNTIPEKVSELEGAQLVNQANFVSINQRLDEIYEGVIQLSVEFDNINRKVVV